MLRGWIFLAGVLLCSCRSEPKASSPVVTAAPNPVVAEIILTGAVQAERVVGVPVPVDGTIDEFRVEMGQHVSEGEVLARISNPRLAGALAAARLNAEESQNRLGQLESSLIAARLEISRSDADAIRLKLELEKATKDFQRQQTMFQEGVTPRLTFEKAEREYNSLKSTSEKLADASKKAAERVGSISAELEPARKAAAQKAGELEDAEAEAATGEVNSPADGIVMARRGKLHQPVTTAISDFYQIAADPIILEVVAPVDTKTAARMHPKQSAQIEIAGIPKPFTGTIREVTSGQAHIEITDPSAQIKPGMTAHVKIKLI
jgi:multidrug resistance efflux pump